VSGVFWLAATKAASQFVTWAITVVVVRLLAPQDYGLMGLATLVIGLLLLFNELGLGAAVIQKAELDARHLQDLRWAIVGTNLALCIVLVLCAPLLAAYFSEPGLTSIIRALAVIFVVQGFGAPASCMLQREMRFKEKSQAELAGNIAGALTTLGCALWGLGVWSLVTGYLLQQVTTNVMYSAYYPVPIAARFSLANVKPFVQFGFQVTFSRILWYTASNADFAVVGRVLGARQLGYYGLAFQFASLPTDKILSIVTQVAFPSFSALQADDATLRRYFLKLVGVVATATFPMFFGLFLVADQGIPLLLTSKWAPMILPLKILCVVSCLRAIGTINTPLLMAKGRPELSMYNNLLQAIVLPAAFYVGAQHGLVGVAVAWLVVWPVLFALLTTQTLNVLRLSVSSYARALAPAMIGSGVMMAVVILAQRLLLSGHPPVTQVALTCALGIVAYAGYQILFNRSVLVDLVGTIRPSASKRWNTGRDQEVGASVSAAAAFPPAEALGVRTE